MEGVLVRFGELGIKSPPVRRRMETILRRNLLNGMLARGVEGDVERIGARVWMAGPDRAALLDVATHTFGVVSASPARRIASTWNDMRATMTELALAKEWTTFAVRARRAGEHKFTSQELAIELGSTIWKAAEAAGRTPAVDLSNPDFAIHIDVRDNFAYVFTDQAAGPGGLPMGCQGKVAVALSDRESCIAAWLMMRRGCAVVPVHAGDTGSVPMDNVEALTLWGMPGDVQVLPVCSGSVAKPILLTAVDRVGKGAAVVTGDTLHSDLAGVPDLAVLRPVCGLPPEDIEALAKQIGLTNETSGAPLSADAGETVESLLSMHRVVSI